MAFEDCEQLSARRDFLSRMGAGVVVGKAALAEEAIPEPRPLLPSIRVGEQRITRLVAGWNPIGGYSYLGTHMNRHMADYFTAERIVDYLRRCEAAGISAHQFSKPEKMAGPLRDLRDGGSRMKFFCLHADGPGKMAVPEVVKTTQPVGIVHHGGVTDRLFREGKSSKVHDFVKRVHDAGVLAGVSAHNPECIQRVADEGWEVDLFMTCFYNLTRSKEELAKMPPVVTVQIGYSFFAADRERMTKVIRQVNTPCLGFKILAAGRKCGNRESVKRAFRFAFDNIKSSDGVIVGMYPRFHDEISENAELAREIAASRVSSL